MAVRPADEVPTGRLAMGEKHGHYNRVFYNALKMRDPRTVLLGANYAGASGVGPISCGTGSTTRSRRSPTARRASRPSRTRRTTSSG